MVGPKEPRKKARAGTNAIPAGVVEGHRVVIIRNGKFVRPPRTSRGR